MHRLVELNDAATLAQWGRPSLFVVCLFQAGSRGRRQKTIVCSTLHDALR
jgi:hypothetical protein